jgi:hypothetical protein
MNDRIQELAEHAHNLAMTDYSKLDIHTGGYESNLIVNRLYTKRLVELIIRECIECGNDLAKHYINNHPEQEQAFLLAAIADYSSEIKRKFGVE